MSNPHRWSGWQSRRSSLIHGRHRRSSRPTMLAHVRRNHWTVLEQALVTSLTVAFAFVEAASLIPVTAYIVRPPVIPVRIAKFGCGSTSLT
jgi:hypothetical protein